MHNLVKGLSRGSSQRSWLVRTEKINLVNKRFDSWLQRDLKLQHPQHLHAEIFLKPIQNDVKLTSTTNNFLKKNLPGYK